MYASLLAHVNYVHEMHNILAYRLGPSTVSCRECRPQRYVDPVVMLPTKNCANAVIYIDVIIYCDFDELNTKRNENQILDIVTCEISHFATYKVILFIYYLL